MYNVRICLVAELEPMPTGSVTKRLTLSRHTGRNTEFKYITEIKLNEVIMLMYRYMENNCM